MNFFPPVITNRIKASSRSKKIGPNKLFKEKSINSWIFFFSKWGEIEIHNLIPSRI